MSKKYKVFIQKVFIKLRQLLCKGITELRVVHKRGVLEKLRESEPVFILGVQKSGTTAIAALLADATGLPATLDITRAIRRPESKILRKYGLEGFDDFLYRYRKEFSRKIVKEPGLTFDYQDIKEYFPKARFVMIIREPKDNIRSILDRLKIPGHLKWLDPEEWSELKKSPAWRINLDSSWLGHWPKSYVDSLAYRWRLSAEIYLSQPDEFILVRYEDFVSDKRKTVEALAHILGFKIITDISEKVDNQYQPKGKAVTNYNDYFGENLEGIREQCDHLAEKLDY